MQNASNEYESLPRRDNDVRKVVMSGKDRCGGDGMKKGCHVKEMVIEGKNGICMSAECYVLRQGFPDAL